MGGLSFDEPYVDRGHGPSSSYDKAGSQFSARIDSEMSKLNLNDRMEKHSGLSKNTSNRRLDSNTNRTPRKRYEMYQFTRGIERGIEWRGVAGVKIHPPEELEKAIAESKKHVTASESKRHMSRDRWALIEELLNRKNDENGQDGPWRCAFIEQPRSSIKEVKHHKGTKVIGTKLVHTKMNVLVAQDILPDHTQSFPRERRKSYQDYQSGLTETHKHKANDKHTERGDDPFDEIRQFTDHGVPLNKQGPIYEASPPPPPPPLPRQQLPPQPPFFAGGGEPSLSRQQLPLQPPFFAGGGEPSLPRQQLPLQPPFVAGGGEPSLPRQQLPLQPPFFAGGREPYMPGRGQLPSPSPPQQQRHQYQHQHQHQQQHQHQPQPQHQYQQQQHQQHQPQSQHQPFFPGVGQPLVAARGMAAFPPSGPANNAGAVPNLPYGIEVLDEPIPPHIGAPGVLDLDDVLQGQTNGVQRGGAHPPALRPELNDINGPPNGRPSGRGFHRDEPLILQESPRGHRPTQDDRLAHDTSSFSSEDQQSRLWEEDEKSSISSVGETGFHDDQYSDKMDPRGSLARRPSSVRQPEQVYRNHRRVSGYPDERPEHPDIGVHPPYIRDNHSLHGDAVETIIARRPRRASSPDPRRDSIRYERSKRIEDRREGRGQSPPKTLIPHRPGDTFRGPLPPLLYPHEVEREQREQRWAERAEEHMQNMRSRDRHEDPRQRGWEQRPKLSNQDITGRSDQPGRRMNQNGYGHGQGKF